jgi:hypothetical protein
VHNARKSSGKVQLVFALSMKREARKNESQIYATVVGEFQGDGVGIPIPLNSTTCWVTLWIECQISCQNFSHRDALLTII